MDLYFGYYCAFELADKQMCTPTIAVSGTSLALSGLVLLIIAVRFAASFYKPAALSKRAAPSPGVVQQRPFLHPASAAHAAAVPALFWWSPVRPALISQSPAPSSAHSTRMRSLPARSPASRWPPCSS